jgi:hypothetical protein
MLTLNGIVVTEQWCRPLSPCDETAHPMHVVTYIWMFGFVFWVSGLVYWVSFSGGCRDLHVGDAGLHLK